MKAIIATLFVIVCAAPILLVAANEAQKQTHDGGIARRKCLVNLVRCKDCHPPLKFTEKGPETDLMRTFSEHHQRAISAWTEEIFLKATKTGKHLGGGRESCRPCPGKASPH